MAELGKRVKVEIGLLDEPSLVEKSKSDLSTKFSSELRKFSEKIEDFG